MSSFSAAMKALEGHINNISDPNRLGVNVVKQVQQAGERGPPATFEATLPPPFINRMGYINLHKANSSLVVRMKKNGTTQATVKQTMRPHVQHGPAPPILSLRVTTLKKVAMKVNHIHDECIMFVKTIYDAHCIVGTNMLVEDDNGDCLMLSVYNMVRPNEDPNDFFPVGTYLALLAPYMKNSGDDPSRNLFLRCDNPDCVRFFPSRRSWLATKRGKQFVDAEDLYPSELRKDGNVAFSGGHYEAAARLYSRALECENIDQGDKLACFGNLAEVRLRQEQWEAAEVHAKFALDLDDTHMKAKFRLATAQIRLNKIYEASKRITDEKNKVFQQLRDDIGRLQEEQEGLYKLEKMRKEAAGRPGQALSTFHSNYTSPNIERNVQISKREGFSYRGTVVAESMKSKILVSSSKAVVFCRSHSQSALQYNFDPYSHSMLNGSQMELENELISLMHRRPALREVVYSLASGLDNPANKNNDKIDTKRIRGIVTNNTFAVASEDHDLEDTWTKFTLFQEGKPDADLTNEQAGLGSGLWVNESIFNHSCIPNCTWKQIGDQMFIWTTRDVQAGEELCLSYVAQDASFSKRETTFRNWILPNIGFCCQCDWCHVIRSSAELRRSEEQVHEAYRRAAELVSSQSMKMAVAANQVMPAIDRQAYINIFSNLPLPLQHNAGADVWLLEGACLAHNGDLKGALKAFEQAAEIKYAVRGGLGVERAKDLWRIVGASMACGCETKASAVLCSIYQDIFVPSSMANVRLAFRDLTLNYTMPWWHDAYDKRIQNKMEGLIARAMNDVNSKTKANRSGKKKSLLR